MGNAVPELKKRADSILSSCNRDGVSETVFYYLLPRR
ncbi:MAG TPA: hypothetical protein H9705_10880 [Candidatus Fusicatenibacter intestinigallinarum]|uniref:Uncharacterized protein n=1 Tax=Candidatus Fusicatenibacter intestinigallinarum TaxID=2838598 RepID=A0A9D2SN67_9FIRM|nr:hypothetical protein [Candidatus Fusicatenibacter intestinigallinarum]